MHTKRVYNLNTAKRFIRVCATLWMALFMVGCGKKCQQVTNTYESLTDTPWRLVETNDRTTGFRKLSNFTFPVMNFGLDFLGSVQSVVNNQQFDSPLCNLVHKADPANNVMVIQYSEGGGGETLGGDEGNQETTPVCPFAGTRTYEYKLGRQLELTDSKTGKYYRFAPFLGIVQPDKECTF